jgi:hypothetical protein
MHNSGAIAPREWEAVPLRLTSPRLRGEVEAEGFG